MNLDHTVRAVVRPSVRRLLAQAWQARALVALRVCWPIYVALLMSVFVAGLQVQYIEYTNPNAAVKSGLAALNLTSNFYSTYNLTLEIIFALVFLAVSAVIFARNSDDWIGVFTAYTLATFGLASSPIMLAMDSLITYDVYWAVPVRIFRFTAWALILLFFYLFPDGKFVYPRLRPWVVLTIIAVQVPWNMFPESPLSPWRWPALAHITALVATWGPALFAQIFRYARISDQVRRLQTKWFVFGATAAVLGSFGVLIPRLIEPALADASKPGSLQFQMVSTGVLYFCVLLMPAAIGISIMRYRLWDINIIISKTLVYIPLTGILTGLYAASLKVFQTFFEALLGTTSDMSVVMTTLVLVATFSPVKDALQNAVDKRFKGPPAPAEKLNALTEEMRLFVELNSVEGISRRVMEDATRAFGAAGGAAYLCRDGELVLSSTLGQWREDDEAMSAPISCDKAQYGVLKITHRASGDAYTQQDEQTLRELAGLLGCTLRAGGR